MRLADCSRRTRRAERLPRYLQPVSGWLDDTLGCWRLWRERQARAGADTNPDRARLAIETHLTRIVRYRPLDTITDSQERATAAHARSWYRKELLDALMD